MILVLKVHYYHTRNKMLTKSKLGFGLMRLPRDENKNIDIARVKGMVDAYMQSGFNYFDTAYIYSGSEQAMHQALVERYQRDAYTIADKLPSHELHSYEDNARVFNESLKRSGVEYFDYYLLHGINRDNYHKFVDNDSFKFVAEMKEVGKIRHVGFSYHDDPELLDRILTKHPEMEFVQLQLNYLDWESEVIFARKNYEVARKHGKPIVVMEPIKGGTLASLPDEIEKTYKDYAPQRSVASWALRYIASLDGVMTILSGMSTEEQLADNLDTMINFEPINKEEAKIINTVTTEFLAIPTIPCTACRYCVDGCPMKILIPDLFSAYNGIKKFGMDFQSKQFYGMHTANENNPASACISCGQCEGACPQHLNIISLLEDVSKEFDV